MSGIIIGLAGEMASGKTTVAEYLQKKYQAGKYRFSDILKNMLDEIYQENNRENLQTMSSILRRAYGEDALAKAIAKKVKNDRHKIVAIDGVRRLGDIKHLKKLDGFKLIYLDTSIRNSYNRIIKRNERIDDQGKSYKEFEKDRGREAEQQIKELKQYAGVVIDNNGTLEDLYRQIDELVK